MTDYNKIVKRASQMKTNVEKNYKLGIPAQWAYIFAKSILSPKKSVKSKKNIGKAPKPTGNKINIKIYKKDYIQLCKNLVGFVDKKGRLPNYVLFDGKKIRARLYAYCFAKIVVYYYKNKSLPAYCTFDYNAFHNPDIKKYGHATVHGCNNMGQNNGHYCGPHSLQECIRNLTGKVISQEQLAAWAGTTSAGSDHDGLNTAVAMAAKKIGVNLSVRWYNFSELGWSGIKKIAESKNQDCVIHNLYRNQWGHYEVVNNVSDSNIAVQNSLGDSCSGDCYCGYVENRSPGEFRSYISGISQKSVMVITRE